MVANGIHFRVFTGTWVIASLSTCKRHTIDDKDGNNVEASTGTLPFDDSGQMRLFSVEYHGTKSRRMACSPQALTSSDFVAFATLVMLKTECDDRR